jgi:hypothetical protein
MLLLIALVVVLLTGLAVVTNLAGPGSGDRPVDHIDPQDLTSWRTSLTALFNRRAAAVSHHDEAAFLADVDHGDPAVLRHQRDEYEGMVALGLSSFTLTMSGFDRYGGADLTGLQLANLAIPGDRSAPLRRYPVVAVAEVTIRYQVAGVDLAPVAVPWVPLIGYQNGRWVVDVESNDPALPEGAGGQPWDIGPITVIHGAGVIIVVDRGRVDLGKRLTSLGDLAVAQVNAFRPDDWSRHTLIMAPSDPAVFATYLKSTPLAVWGAITAHFDTTVPAWEADPDSHFAGARIMVHPAILSDPDDRIEADLAHEFTHAALWSQTSVDTPDWLLEGIANYVAYPLRNLTPEDIRHMLRAMKVPAQLPARDPDFYSDTNNYFLGWLACRMIAERYGQQRLLDLYLAIPRYDGTSDAFPNALQATLGLTISQLTSAWHDYLRTAAA